MKKNVKAFALAGIGAVVLVGGTFAYYNSTQTFYNQLKSTKYGGSAVEKFNPPTDWVPGAKADKEIFATNTGEGEVWVRIKFDETWQRNGEAEPFKSFSSKDGTFNTNKPNSGEVPEAGTNQVSATDGLTAADTGSVVYKELVNVVNAAESETKKWYYNSTDGYYYYTSTLGTGESTEKLLDDITLCKDVDLGAFDKVKRFLATSSDLDKDAVLNLKPDATWASATPSDLNGKYLYIVSEDKAVDGKSGYAKADYTLTITTEFIQADAVTDPKTGKVTSNAAKDLRWAWYPGKN